MRASERAEIAFSPPTPLISPAEDGHICSRKDIRQIDYLMAGVLFTATTVYCVYAIMYLDGLRTHPHPNIPSPKNTALKKRKFEAITTRCCWLSGVLTSGWKGGGGVLRFCV